jgi:hypothetical protein
MPFFLSLPSLTSRVLSKYSTLLLDRSLLSTIFASSSYVFAGSGSCLCDSCSEASPPLFIESDSSSTLRRSCFFGLSANVLLPTLLIRQVRDICLALEILEIGTDVCLKLEKSTPSKYGWVNTWLMSFPPKRFGACLVSNLIIRSFVLSSKWSGKSISISDVFNIL